MSGEYTEVWEGTWNKNTPVAVTTLKSQGILSTYDFLQSANLMKNLQHSNLIQFYALCLKEDPVLIITEFMKRGSMLEYLRGEGRSLKLSQLIDMAAQVTEGMAYLERRKIIHRDLTARNIQVGEGILCKVANFELARVLDTDKAVYVGRKEEKVAIKWMAIEAASQNRFNIKSDVWSFGIVLYEIITYGRFPYPGMTNAQAQQQIQQGYRMPRPMGCPDKLYDIMLNCWQEEPANRLTFETLQQKLDDFFLS